jgi:predicted phosphodiesterase
VAVLALLVQLALSLLVDWRVRLHTLVKLDPAPGPVTVEVGGVTLTVTGALLRDRAPDGTVVLRAWAPDPVLRVVRGSGPQPVRLRVENLPARATLDAAGPVDEHRSGIARILSFDASATRRLGFRVPDDAVTFAVLGDTGDSGVFSEALHTAAVQGADFLIHAGDVVYEDSQMPAITAILAGAPIPVYVARGNHDYRNAQRIAFLRGLGPPYYVIRMGGATIVVLDNGGEYIPTFWRRSSQYRWWRERLGEPRAGPLFVAMHKPPFDRRTGPLRAPMLDPPFARALMADFKAAGVDAVLTGHVHETHLWVEDGIPYVVVGEGMAYPERAEGSRMAWVRVHGWAVEIEQVPIWRRGR